VKRTGEMQGLDRKPLTPEMEGKEKNIKLIKVL
jgi:hypothetical protein